MTYNNLIESKNPGYPLSFETGKGTFVHFIRTFSEEQILGKVFVSS